MRFEEAALVIVVAMAENGVIGASGTLPWHLPADLRRVKRLTMGKPLIMGRKTYESIGRPLPGRKTIVLTKDRGFSVPGVIVCRSFDAALEEAQKHAKSMDASEVVAFGGAGIYSQALLKAQKIYKTEIHLSPQGDTFFPDYDKDEWSEIKREYVPASTDMPVAHSNVCLERFKKAI